MRDLVNCYMGVGICVKGHCTMRIHCKMTHIGKLTTHIRDVSMAVTAVNETPHSPHTCTHGHTENRSTKHHICRTVGETPPSTSKCSIRVGRPFIVIVVIVVIATCSRRARRTERIHHGIRGDITMVNIYQILHGLCSKDLFTTRINSNKVR